MKKRTAKGTAVLYSSEAKKVKDRNYFPDHLVPWVHLSWAYLSKQNSHRSAMSSALGARVVNPPWGAHSLGIREAAHRKGSLLILCKKASSLNPLLHSNHQRA